MRRLGFDPRAGEPALVSILRSESLGTLGTLGDAEVLAEARRRFALTGSDPAALDGPLKARWLGIVAANAGEAEWDRQIGRASCRERGCPYVEISVVAVAIKKKQ